MLDDVRPDLERPFSNSASFNLDELELLGDDNVISLSRTMCDLQPRQSSSPLPCRQRNYTRRRDNAMTQPGSPSVAGPAAFTEPPTCLTMPVTQLRKSPSSSSLRVRASN